MKADDLLDAIGLIEDSLIENVSVKSRHTGKWLKYSSIAACFICLTALGIFLFKQFHMSKIQETSVAVVSEKPETDENYELDACDVSYDMTVFQDMVYFSCTGRGTFLANSETVTMEKISDFGGLLICSAEELFCWKTITGEICQIKGNSIFKMGEIPTNSQLIGVAEGAFYWYPTVESNDDMGIYQTTANSDEKKILLHLSSTVQKACLIGRTIYYQIDTGAIFAFDLTYGAILPISDEFEQKTYMGASSNIEQYYMSEKCTFFDEFVVIPVKIYRRDSAGGYVIDEFGCYKLLYGNGQAKLLTSEQIVSNFCLYNQKLYYISLEDSTAVLNSYDLNSEIVDLSCENDTFVNAAEILVYAQKCYYTIPSASGDEIYSYDISTGTSTAIFQPEQNQLDGNYKQGHAISMIDAGIASVEALK